MKKKILGIMGVVGLPLFIVAYRPSGVPADLKSAVKKGSTY